MKVVVLVACCLVLSEVDCWARRRRMSERKKRDEEDTSSGELEEETHLISERSPTSVVSAVSLETCHGDVNACGFTVKCHCCAAPSFGSCGETGLIGSASIKLAMRRRSASSSEAESAENNDEAGCALRAVEYNGEQLCIPGNVASMIAVVHQSAGGDCYPVYPLNCQGSLQDNVIYYQYFYVPGLLVDSTLQALTLAGHHCEISEHHIQGGIKCAI